MSTDEQLSKLERLAALRNAGALSEEEFEAQKKALLNSYPAIDTRVLRPTRRSLVFVGKLVALALAGFLLYSSISHFSGNTDQSLPTCDSKRSISLLQKTLDEGPAAKTLGLKVIDISDPQQAFRTDTVVECTALVRLNNAARSMVRYSFSIEGNKMFTEATILGY